MTVTEQMVNRAVAKAAELGLFNEFGDIVYYLRCYSTMNQILNAALENDTLNCD